MFKEPNTLLQTSVETQPEFSKLLGISIISATEKQVRAELMVKDEFLGVEKRPKDVFQRFDSGFSSY